jgi:hypothetical protein
MVFHKGDLSEDHKDLLNDLKRVSFAGDSTLNLEIAYTDLKGIEQNPLEGLDKGLNYPLIMLSYPEETGIPYPLWLGELNRDNVSRLKYSPMREEISKLLLRGTTAVFLFLESGNSEPDKKYYDLLENELADLSKKLRIPTSALDINGNPIEIDDFKEVEIQFSLRKISRQNQQEQIFIKMLLGTESDLTEYQLPLAFPIFGQGRSLYALVGAGITRKNIGRACRSLVDWCSCEIKALHQGVDLLFLSNWSERQGGSWIKDEPLPPLSGFSEFLKGEVKTDTLTLSTTEPGIKKTVQESDNAEIVVEPDSSEIKSESGITSEYSQIWDNIKWLLIIFVSILILFSIMTRIKKVKSRS